MTAKAKNEDGLFPCHPQASMGRQQLRSQRGASLVPRQTRQATYANPGPPATASDHIEPARNAEAVQRAKLLPKQRYILAHLDQLLGTRVMPRRDRAFALNGSGGAISALWLGRIGIDPSHHNLHSRCVASRPSRPDQHCLTRRTCTYAHQSKLRDVIVVGRPDSRLEEIARSLVQRHLGYASMGGARIELCCTPHEARCVRFSVFGVR